MFYENSPTPFYAAFLTLCAQKGVSPSVAARDAGISSGAPTAWKKGAVPKSAQRQKLCSYFGVTDDILLGYVKIDEYGTRHISTQIPSIPTTTADERRTISHRETEKTPTPKGERLDTQIDAGFFRVMQTAQEKGFSPEDIQIALDFLDRARRRDQE